jgi:hypothetical protein
LACLSRLELGLAVFALIGSAPTLAAARPIHNPHHALQRLRPGMVVVDRSGAAIGAITQVGLVDGGKASVRLRVNGAKILVADASLSAARDPDEVTISLTPSQIQTAAILNSD